MVSPTTQTVSDAAQLKIIPLIAKELGVGSDQVKAAVALLDEGSTVPFIARYRKEVTGNLDDTHLRTLEERFLYLRELELRRAAILASIEEQGKLTDILRGSIEAAETKQTLEDLYLPYKPKRRTRAQIAREAGLEPLADALFADPMLDPEQEAVKYLNVKPAAEGVEAINVPDAKSALEGARDILVERFAETAELLAKLRTRLWDQGVVTSTVMKGKETAQEEKFRDYYAYSETIRTIPSHRALALFRGRTLGVLKIELGLGEALEAVTPHPCVATIAAHVGIEDRGRRADTWLMGVCDWAWRTKVHLHLTVELLVQLREAAEAEAIKIFGRNLHELLLAAPAGPKAVLGLDPGIRTGCKVAVVDATGKLLETTTIYPLQPRNDWQGSLATLARLVVQHGVELISIGNGTGSRETDKLAIEVIKLVAVPQAGTESSQDRGQRSRRLGLFGLGLRRGRISRVGCQPARRRLHRPASARSAGGVGEDRSQGDRRRPISARCQPTSAGAFARCDRRRLRQCRGRGRQHGIGAAARTGVGSEQGAGEEHRRVP